MRYILFVIASVLLSACSSIQYRPDFKENSPTQQASWQEHQIRISQQQDNWRFSGRFGASTQDDAWSGSIWWQQKNDDYNIELAGPLNQGTIRLLGNKEHSELQIAEDSRYSDGDAESLLQRYTGWSLPLSGLRYWVLGLPQPLGEKQYITLDEQGRIASIRQPHWHIQFQRYRKTGELQLPRKIVLQNDEVKVRLVFDQWNFNG